MLDILLDKTGDLQVTENGDIELTYSKTQAALIRLRWILGEWRHNPSLGLPWFEEIFKKNPNLQKIQSSIRGEILKVDGIEDAAVTEINYDLEFRRAKFKFEVVVDNETFVEEVEFYGRH